MQVCEPIKKTFVRFFTKSRLFTDGYRVAEGDSIPRETNIPDLEVHSRELADLDFFLPDDAIGFIFYDVIATQVNDNGEIKELFSGKINKSGRYFFQTGDYGRIATKDEAPREWKRQTSMRRYCRQPVPKKIILYPGEHYYKHEYSFSRAGRHHTRESSYHVCTFDFLETDVAIPVYWVFPWGHMIKAAAEKKGWVKRRHAA
jgi:hypothetical protein